MFETIDRIIFFDTETTGFSAENNRIIEIAAIECGINHDKKMFTTTDMFHTYIKQNEPLPEVIVNLTHITDEMLADKPYEKEVANSIHTFFGNKPFAICAYNSPFDVRFMNALYKRNGLGEFTPENDIDLLPIARTLVGKATPNHRLGTLCDHFKLNESNEAVFHNAYDDTLMTIRLAEALWNLE